MRAAIMKKLKSPLVFRSNIFPVDEPHIHTDRKFIQSLRDPRSIKAFRNRFRSAPFSDLQKRIERRGIDLDCAYAEPGYHPWGTKVIDGEEKLVCLCENYSCHYFKECRPDFDISAMEGDVSEGVASHDAVFEGGGIPRTPLSKTFLPMPQGPQGLVTSMLGCENMDLVLLLVR